MSCVWHIDCLTKSDLFLFTYTVIPFNPVPLCNIPTSSSEYVTGITNLGNELFAVRRFAYNIEVYDADNCTLLRTIGLPVQAYYNDLAASEVNRRVYVSVMNANVILSVDVANSDVITTWPVCNGPATMYVTACEYVLVACVNANKIQLYTPAGAWVWEVSLQSGLADPRGIVQLSATQFGITQASFSPSVIHRYCVVGLDGRAQNCVGGAAGSSLGQFSGPYDMSVDSTSGTVYIADMSNGRIVVIDPITSTASLLTLNLGGLQPYSVHYDRSRDRLYVGLYGNAQPPVMVFGK